jgi:hypothetical protein
MNEKSELIAALREELHRWEGLLAGLNEAQISTPLPSSHWSVKDVVAHLRAWQQVTIARLEAALSNEEPEFPGWLGGEHPEAEDNLETYNERIYQGNRDQPWAPVHRAWNDGFTRCLELAETIPEEDLLERGRYPWLPEYPLSVVLLGTYDHHREHLEPLLVLFGPSRA